MKRLLASLVFSFPLTVFSQGDSFGFNAFETYQVDFGKGVIVHDASKKAYTLPFDVPFLLRGDVSNSVTSIKLFIYDEEVLVRKRDIIKQEYKNAYLIKSQGLPGKKTDSLWLLTPKSIDLENNKFEQLYYEPEFIEGIKKIATAEGRSVQFHEWHGNDAINKITGKVPDTLSKKDSFFITCSPLKPFTAYKFIFIVERHLTSDERTDIFTTSVFPNLKKLIKADDNAITEGKLFTAQFNTDYYKELEEKNQKIYSGINTNEISAQVTTLHNEYISYKNREMITLVDVRNFQAALDSIYNHLSDSTTKQRINTEYPSLKATLSYLLILDEIQLQKILYGVLAYDGTANLLIEINQSSFKTDTALQNQIIDRYRTLYNKLDTIAFSLRKIIFDKSIQNAVLLIPHIDTLNVISGKVTSQEREVMAIKRFYIELLQITKAASDRHYEKQIFRLKSNGLSSHEYATRANWYILPDIGATAFGWPGTAINFIGSVGINLHFSALNREATYSIFKNGCIFKKGTLVARNLSLYLGVTTNWFRDTNKEILIETETLKINHLWKENSLMTGIGIRMFEGFRISGGAIWARQQDVRNLNNISRTVALPYVSATLDIDLRNIVMKTVGVYKEITTK